ncbi:hypothetical protein SUGI_0511610 [Cryptomeria japonica]|nr:hypothetical protein SUGI_0511610 [Cryptomeria japonica]
MNYMNMALYVLHTMNHQNMAEKSNRRSELVLEMKKCFEELGIKFLLQEVHVKFVGYWLCNQSKFFAILISKVVEGYWTHSITCTTEV